MKLNEDYITVLNDTDNKDGVSFKIKIINENSPFLDWIFSVGGMSFLEDENEETATLSIEYEIVYPEKDSEAMKEFPTPTDQRIVDALGKCVEDLLYQAIQNNGFTVLEDAN